MKKYLIIIISILIGCGSLEYKKKDYRGSNLINKKILLVPINLSYYESDFFEDTKMTKVENELLVFNEKILQEVKKKFNIFKLDLWVDSFEISRTNTFDQIWSKLKENQKKDIETRIGINKFSEQNVNLIEALVKSKNKSDNGLNPDFIIVYRINYFQDTPVKEGIVQFSHGILVLAGIPSLNIPNPPDLHKGILQYLVIEKNNQEIILIGEVRSLIKDNNEKTEVAISRFINSILEYEKENSYNRFR